MSSNGYVVAKPFYGFGGNLAVLSCAWLSAKKLDRRLIVDWRGMHYGDQTDYFDQLFKPLSLQDPLSAIAGATEGVFPPYWGEFILEIPQQQKGYSLAAATSDLLFDPDSGFSPEMHPIAVVSRDGSFFHRPEHSAEIRRFFEELTPIDAIEAKIRDFVAQNFGNFVIGAHFRHGNGEPTVVPPDFEWFCKSIDELTSRGPDPQAQIFIATDCSAALEMFQMKYGNRIQSYPKTYLPLGTGGMHYRQTNDEKVHSAIEALIDIRLLSLCQAFVGSKSFFSASANLWGQGFDKTNSRWFTPRLRAFKPTSNQLPVASEPEIMAALGSGFPIDNIFVNREMGEISFQDVIIGHQSTLLSSPEEAKRVKQEILRHRLY